ncbi:isoflavone reductase [Corynascus novoguineensis]|uniref:Isoflavone reductase n=1 Tax=Corynascus novoguineensis TaxID=1126955 RepID=A0AAN7CPN6_9PEZI|nr:isoflavone reductase [Corynascus novoguineensis]
MVFKTVAVVGASGNLGAPVVQALLEAGFQVTAIARETSTSTFPKGVEVRKTDLTSVKSLAKSFSGQDVVILTLPHSESDKQTLYIDAAVAAGVKRFIPAEWGFNTRPGRLPEPIATIMSSKTRAVDYLIEKTKQHPELTWTGIATGPFLDWGLDYGAFGIDPVARTIRIVDSGDEPVSTCSLAFIARAVVAVLEPHRERETANRYLEVVEHAVTQNALQRLLEEEPATTTRGEFAIVDRLNAADLARSRDEKLARGDLQGAFFEALWVMAFADGARTALKEEDTANRELGLESKDLREIIRDFVKTRGR